MVRNGTPGRIRTCDLRIRNPLLYPTELRAHYVLYNSTKIAYSMQSSAKIKQFLRVLLQKLRLHEVE